MTGDLNAIGFRPQWPAPANVGAFITYRSGGFSCDEYASNNLGDHVGDDPTAVARNRQQLREHLAVDQLCWLEQVHGRELVTVQEFPQPPQADASISREAGRACVVLTADCLPLLICDRLGRQVAAVHCGWRGLAQGMIGSVIDTFIQRSIVPDELLVYLGPAISGAHYEVGDEVRSALAATLPETAPDFWRAVADKPGHSLVDLYAVARGQLQAAGVRQVFGGDRCSYAEADCFYSYRREGVTGRMASVIWLQNPPSGDK